MQFHSTQKNKDFKLLYSKQIELAAKESTELTQI